MLTNESKDNDLVFFSFNFQIADGKPDLKTTVKMAKQAFGNGSPKVEVARKMASTCGERTTDTERCEMASQMFVCALSEAKVHGYEFSDFM